MSKVTKKINKWLLGSVMGAIILGVATNYIYDYIKREDNSNSKSNSNSISTNVNGNNNNITINQNIGLNEKAIKMIIKPYIDNIKRIERDKNATQDELNKAKKELDKKLKELKELKNC